MRALYLHFLAGGDVVLSGLEDGVTYKITCEELLGLTPGQACERFALPAMTVIQNKLKEQDNGRQK